MIRAGIVLTVLVAAVVLPLIYSAQDPQPPGGSTTWTAETTAIVSAINQNLLALGETVTGNVQAVDTATNRSYVDGYFQAKGNDKFLLHGGSSGHLTKRNGAAWNHIEPTGEVGALNWSDSTSDPHGVYAGHNGIIDIRAMTWLAHLTSSLQVQAGSEIVNGVTCRRLEGGHVRFWVDSAATHRIIRFEYLNGSGQPDFATDLSGWASRNAQGAELPSSWQAVRFASGLPIRSVSYTASSIQTGVALNDSLFDTWVPPDLGTIN